VAGGFRNAFFVHSLFNGWLGPERSSALLAYAHANESRFFTSPIRNYGRLTTDANKRISMMLKDLGPFADDLRSRAVALAPDLCRRFGAEAFVPTHVELEFIAHGDGAFFAVHRDTNTGRTAWAGPRRLTLVYYLCSQPKRFSGGQLRLYSPHGEGGPVLDIEPEHDRLLAFPSMAPHSVERVSCPDASFADWRFAVNIWLHG
jgi:Rps23 Pro-64 3,4-dihydroxylase Tpa1-like proline 4-hydroxylase